MNILVLLAQRGADSPVNQWLNEHPLVLGLLALALGAVIGGWGVYELRQGVAHDKYGNEMRGGLGKFMGILRVVVGVGICVFGIYKMVAG